MITKKAGDFVAHVRYEGYPTWIDLTIGRDGAKQTHLTLSVEEIRDLDYVVQSAIRIAVEKQKSS